MVETPFSRFPFGDRLGFCNQEEDLAFEIEKRKVAAQREAPLQKEGVLDRVSAYHCARGSYSCMVHFCLHNFCSLPESSKNTLSVFLFSMRPRERSAQALLLSLGLGQLA